MSDKPIIQIDDDWKRQAQEEKRKLAEEQAARKAPPAPAASSAAAAPTAADGEPSSRAMPQPSFATLVQSIMTQALYYLGELSQDGEPPMLSLDVARHQIDTLAILDEKTQNNLSADERSLLDQTLYDLRSRFVSIAHQYIR